VERAVVEAGRLDAELLAIEDRFVWDVNVTLETAAEIERAAEALGAEELVVRARLCQAHMWMRRGELARAARRIWEIDLWATERDRSIVRARANLVLAAVHRYLGDPATSLEHAIRAVEYLDDSATIHAKVWHRAKLAQALAEAGSRDAARTRFTQAEQLASSHEEYRLHMAVLNNFAYFEYKAGAYDRARQVAERLLGMAARHHVTLDPADLDTIGCIQIGSRLFAEAEQTMIGCIGLHGEGRHDDVDALAEYLLTLARARRGLGAVDRAQDALDESHALCTERGLSEVLVRVHQEQAELHAARGDFAAAYATHKVFFSAHEQLHSAQREAQARTRQAMFETTEARQEAEQFREQARRDPLTGLRNRRYVDEQLPLLIADPVVPMAIALLDLDHFKRVNDRLSHHVGDQVLIMVARLLETALASSVRDGFAARMGGEEFLLALPGATTAEAVERMEAVRTMIRSHAWWEVTGELPVTVSIGVASTEDLSIPNQPGLLAAADRNLYAAKQHGRDQVVSGVKSSGRRTHRVDKDGDNGQLPPRNGAGEHPRKSDEEALQRDLQPQQLNDERPSLFRDNP
jgi:diguanylate cyclase (GGDEF)-like protein